MPISSQGFPSLQGPHRVGLSFMAALAVHAGALAALTLWPSQNTVKPPGEQEITIDLAPAMETAEAVVPAEASTPAIPLTTEAEVEPPADSMPEVSPVESEAENAPPAMAEAAPEEAIAVEEPPAVPEPVPAISPSEVVIAQPLPEPEPEPLEPIPPKGVERKPVSRPRRAMPERRSPPSSAHQGQASSSREDSRGAAASADPSVLNRYAARVAASLRSRLRYPVAAGRQGLTGVATLRFSMDRSGRIISATLVRGSGSALLDDAALAAARPGSSLPAAPDALPQQQFTFSVPLRFDIR